MKNLTQKQKTIILTAIVAIVAVILIGVLVYTEVISKNKAKSESSKIVTEFYEHFNDKTRNVIYYASPSCSYCSLETPILETISKDYSMEYYYLDSSKLTEKERTEILDVLSIEQATPTTLVVENGKVISKNVGYVQGSEYVKFFVDAKMLPEDATYSSEDSITFIDYTKYTELVAQDSTNIVVVGQTGCSHCTAIKPALNAVAKEYNLDINYLNITEMTEEENNDFFASLKNIGYNDPDFLADGSFGTPLTLIITNGKVSNYISGERTTSQIVKQFQKFGLID